MVGCTFQGCQYDTDQALTQAKNPTLADHLAMLRLHYAGVLPPPQAALPVIPQQNNQWVSPPKLILVDGKMEEAAWEVFANAWENFKSAGNVQVGNKNPLLASVLGETYSKVFGRLGAIAYEALTEQSLLERARELVVIRRNKLVNRMKLASMQ